MIFSKLLKQISNVDNMSGFPGITLDFIQGLHTRASPGVCASFSIKHHSTKIKRRYVYIQSKSNEIQEYRLTSKYAIFRHSDIPRFFNKPVCLQFKTTIVNQNVIYTLFAVMLIRLPRPRDVFTAVEFLFTVLAAWRITSRNCSLYLLILVLSKIYNQITKSNIDMLK